MELANLLSMTDGGCAPCQQRLAAVEQVDEQPTAATAAPVQWSGVIGVEGATTGDGRLIATGALRWEVPLPLRYVAEDSGAHDGAVVVGTIDEVVRSGDGLIRARGTLDGSSARGAEALRQVREGLTSGVSMDLDDVSFEVRVVESLLTDADALPGPDEEGRVVVMEGTSSDELFVTTSARIRAATIVAIPAFVEARIALAEPGVVPSLAASGAAVAPPAAWFADPGLRAPTPLTVTDDGRVFGHLALWGTCHIGQPSSCITPPHSKAEYRFFRTGSVMTEEGRSVPVGRITLGTGHAPPSVGSEAAQAHYDHTGTAVADVAAGEDGHGIWVAGAVRPGVTPEQLRVLRASPLSGDWRAINGALELVGALAVNVPGFPVPVTRGMVAAGGRQLSLVASGVLPPGEVPPRQEIAPLSVDEVDLLRSLAVRSRADDLRRRVDARR